MNETILGPVYRPSDILVLENESELKIKIMCSKLISI